MRLVWARLAEAVASGGRAALISVVATEGSVPRGPGARIVIGEDGGFFGTIGGGTLEYEAIAQARAALARGAGPVLRDWPLGPALGQCCGGRVVTLTELFSSPDSALIADFAAREAAAPFETLTKATPTGVTRRIMTLNSLGGSSPTEPKAELRGAVPPAAFIERFGQDRTPLLLFGAGHVGRAVVLALTPLPFAIRWLDPRDGAFPPVIAGAVETVAKPDIDAELARAPSGAFVLAMTHLHPLDLAICLAALRREDFPYIGLIGSATKRARFIRRMRAIGFGEAQEARLICPIGVPGIHDKEPAAIAASVAAQLLLWRERHDDKLEARRVAGPELQEASERAWSSTGGAMFSPDDERCLAHAVALSRERMEAGFGGPFGALIARDGEILAEGWNEVTSANDPTAHAEVTAIRRACAATGSFSLAGATLYTSCEPCPMCLAAAYWARIARIVYANTREDAAAIGFDDAFIYDEMPKPPQARVIAMEHLPLAGARAAFAAWAEKPDKVRY